MKKFLLFATLVVAVFMVSCCSSEKEPDVTDVVGTWAQTHSTGKDYVNGVPVYGWDEVLDPTENKYFTLKSDKTGMLYDGEDNHYHVFTWSLKNNALTIIVEEIDVFAYKLISIEGNTMVLWIKGENDLEPGQTGEAWYEEYVTLIRQ